MKPAPTPAQQAYADIVQAAKNRHEVLRRSVSRKTANWHQALGRVDAWLKSHTAASIESLRAFLKTHGADLDRVLTGDVAGNKRRARIYKIVNA